MEPGSYSDDPTKAKPKTVDMAKHPIIKQQSKDDIKAVAKVNQAANGGEAEPTNGFMDQVSAFFAQVLNKVASRPAGTTKEAVYIEMEIYNVAGEKIDPEAELKAAIAAANKSDHRETGRRITRRTLATAQQIDIDEGRATDAIGGDGTGADDTGSIALEPPPPKPEPRPDTADSVGGTADDPTPAEPPRESEMAYYDPEYEIPALPEPVKTAIYIANNYLRGLTDTLLYALRGISVILPDIQGDHHWGMEFLKGGPTRRPGPTLSAPPTSHKINGGRSRWGCISG